MGSQVVVNGDHETHRRQGHNDLSKPWMVQKFGGTSVGKFADKIVEEIVRYIPTLHSYCDF